VITQRSAIEMTLLWLFTLGMMLDIATFAVMMQAGGMALEANTLVVGALYAAGGYPLVLAGKVAVVAYLLFAVKVQTRPRVAHLVLLAGVLVGALGAMTNALTIRAVV
jgi:hypothetical protein